MNETTPRDSSASGSTRDKVRDTAADLAGSAKETASRLAGQAKDKAEETFNTQRQSVVGEIETFASVIREAGDRLRERNASPIGAQVISTVAERLDSFGRSMRGKDLDAIFTDVESFARRSPAAFLGTAAALGFLASRFIKSSRPSSSDAWRATGFASNEFASSSQFGTTPGSSAGFGTSPTGSTTGSTGAISPGGTGSTRRSGSGSEGL